MYPGTSGKTQGDKNEINPARKAPAKETSFIPDWSSLQNANCVTRRFLKFGLGKGRNRSFERAASVQASPPGRFRIVPYLAPLPARRSPADKLLTDPDEPLIRKTYRRFKRSTRGFCDKYGSQTPTDDVFAWRMRRRVSAFLVSLTPVYAYGYGWLHLGIPDALLPSGTERTCGAVAQDRQDFTMDWTPNRVTCLRVIVGFAAVFLFGRGPWLNLSAVALTVAVHCVRRTRRISSRDEKIWRRQSARRSTFSAIA